ncbi:hypothetical protein ColLi_09208 [Colletotrichum liriopes]|uniref:Uncharacterized protein n=1 Tax=Colletotrichum liriopes TaxID=708192 RepID=A0AA37GTA2_9PEZI|nr:hypothetical protein ColLi_09208 [Colletotrichum liriopes]
MAYKEARTIAETLSHDLASLEETRGLLDSNPVLEIFLELQLREVVDKAAPEVGDSLIGEIAERVPILHARVLANIYGEFRSVYQLKAFEAGGICGACNDVALEDKKVESVAREMAVKVEYKTAEKTF